MSPETLFAKMIGKWEGRCRTWFEPGKLEDESDVAGEFTGVMERRYVRHTYTGSMKGKPRHGEDTIAFNPTTKMYQSSWIDDFHTNKAILFSEGSGTELGFSVMGHYDVGGGNPQWGWRTEFSFLDDSHLTITAYNIMPGEEEAKAVETTYHRVR